jgi:hypothetical protein
MDEEKRKLLEKQVTDLGLTFAFSEAEKSAIVEARDNMEHIPTVIDAMRDLGFALVGPVQVCAAYIAPFASATIIYLATFDRS